MDKQGVMSKIAKQDSERLLLHIADQGGSVPHSALATVANGHERYGNELAQELIGLSLADPNRSMAGELTLTGFGVAVAEEIRNSFVNGPRRADLIRRGVLQTLSDGGRVWAHDMAEDWPGQPINPAPTADEIESAIVYLKDHQLINATGTSGGTLAIGIKPVGQDALRNESLLVSGQATTPSFYDNRNQSVRFDQVAGNVTGIQSGDHNTQTNTVVLTPAQVGQIRDLFAQALEYVDDLPEEQAPTVRDAIEAGLAEAKSANPEPGRLKQFADKALYAVAAAAGTEAGQLILPLLGAVPSLLGIG